MNLAKVQEEAYPLIELNNLVKMRFINIQEEFYKLVAQTIPLDLTIVKPQSEEILRLFIQLEPLVEDRQSLNTLRLNLKEYLQEGKSISKDLTQFEGDISSIKPQMDQLFVKGSNLATEIEEMQEESYKIFGTALARAKKNSEKMLWAGLLSSIAGVFIGGILSLNVILNWRLTQEKKTLEKEVKVRTQELESFVYTISHDLKSPVVSMQGMASIFLEDYGNKVDEKGRHYLERVMANANYMEELINDLLTLSRVGRKQENPEMADLHEILKEILDIHKEHFKEKIIEVVVQPSLPHFEFERVHLTHLFQNLITNAAKFMGNQPHPRIEVGGREDKGWLEFYVKDNGIGIDPEYHEKIFGIFQRLREVEVEGTGVGLSIVRKIVDTTGGRIWVESQKGEGATFFLRLPQK
jgi:signal transduction histidine kinase